MENLSLFDNTDTLDTAPNINRIETEGIKYAGSKTKLLPQILELAGKVPSSTVLDGFSGSTRVSQAFAQIGKTVICNDISVWSETFAKCYLKNTKEASFYADLIFHLNGVKPYDGWFTENYGGSPHNRTSVAPDGLKKPWQTHNTRKLDAIRDEIDRVCSNEVEKAVALTSLILALDKVDNTLGHFVSYLNEWAPRSFNSLKLEIPRLRVNRQEHSIHRADIFTLLSDTHADLAYFDPPYGSNNEKMPPSRVRYASYYHLWTSIILNDKPELFGKAKRRVDTSDKVAASVFEEFRRDEDGNLIAVQAIQKMLQVANVKHIILSYSSGGKATAEQLNDAISTCGRVVEVIELDHKRNVMASMRWTNEWIRDAEEPNREFLFLIEKA